MTPDDQIRQLMRWDEEISGLKKMLLEEKRINEIVNGSAKIAAVTFRMNEGAVDLIGDAVDLSACKYVLGRYHLDLRDKIRKRRDELLQRAAEISHKISEVLIETTESLTWLDQGPVRRIKAATADKDEDVDQEDNDDD